MIDTVPAVSAEVIGTAGAEETEPALTLPLTELGTVADRVAPRSEKSESLMTNTLSSAAAVVKVDCVSPGDTATGSSELAFAVVRSPKPTA